MVDVVNNIAQAEQIMYEALSLGFKERQTAQPDLATLRTAFKSPLDRSLVYVASEDRLYRWSRYSVLADDNLNVIAPTGTPAAGRWLRVSSALTFGPNRNKPLQSRQTGFCKAVELYQGGADSEQQLDRVFGSLPSLLIQWLGDDPKPKSTLAGALYEDWHDFQILVLSKMLRPMPAAMLGSPEPSELAKDPGITGIIGQIRKVLAGMPTRIPGAVHIELGPARIEIEDLAERFFCASVRIRMFMGFAIPDEDLEPTRLDVQPRLTEIEYGAAKFDRLNYVAQGFFVEPGPGLARTYAAGIAFVGGVAVSATPPPYTFAASADTYRDLAQNGTLSYVVVAVGAKPPPPAAGLLRIGRTRTTATDIESDHWMCSSSFAYGPPMAFG
jgi:hypothetical protein